MGEKVNRRNYDDLDKRRENAKASNGQRHKKRKKDNRTKAVIVFLIVVMVALVVLSQTVFFNIEKIEVVGETIYNNAEIIRVSGILIGDNMFRLKLDEIEKKLDFTLPYLSNVSVSRKLPNKIEISAEPAIPVGAIEFENAYFLIDKNLKILETDVKVVPTELPVILGIEATECESGTYLNNSDITTLDILFTLTQAFEKYNLNNINKMDFTNLMDIKVYYDDRIEILLGAPNDFDYKLKFASFLLENDIDQTERGTIDVRLNTAGQATFRPQKDTSSLVVPSVETPEVEGDDETA